MLCAFLLDRNDFEAVKFVIENYKAESADEEKFVKFSLKQLGLEDKPPEPEPTVDYEGAPL
jgi:hypothetical protein